MSCNGTRRADRAPKWRYASIVPGRLAGLPVLLGLSGALIALACAAGLPTARAGSAQAATPDLSARDALLLREAFHLQAALGAEVWPGWAPSEGPVLYLVGEHAYLIGHPAPPADFAPMHSDALARDVQARPRTPEEGDLQATYPIAGHATVVIAAPEDDTDAWRWTLVVGHELFHCWQGHGKRHLDPFTGEYAALHELSYPFPYDDEAVRAALRLEAELVHRLASDGQAGAASGAASGAQPDRVPARLLEQCALVDRAVLGDERHLLFKRWEEWHEGIAKHVERELSRAAAEPGRYAPLPEFAARFPGDGYAAAWDDHFAGQLNPVRFVGEGVRGRVMFYYLGLGKAVALDRLLPDWKARYRESSLDELLMEAAAG
jgi:hypothetical protein